MTVGAQHAAPPQVANSISAILCSPRQLPDLSNTRYCCWHNRPVPLFGAPGIEIFDDVIERQHVGVLLIHVKEIDRVASLVAIEHAFFGDDHA